MTALGSVLIVEDDSALRQSLRDTLEAAGFCPREASSGEEAMLALHRSHFETVLLDINMPGIGGMEACRRIRQTYPLLPILVLTVRDEEKDKIEALDAGADDYITKPFQFLELTARLRSAIRRFRARPDSPKHPVTVGEITLDPCTRRVTKRGEDIRMTPKEFELLHTLMRYAGRPLAHQRLLVLVWGAGYGGEREYLRTYISQLRRKLEDDPAHPVYLLTDSYVGYRFRDL
ncbi:MAG TPA: response regulator transcription factor [Acidobacteriaceae bacterium]|jgi:two-component system KDP operon response regulator KdpE